VIRFACQSHAQELGVITARDAERHERSGKELEELRHEAEQCNALLRCQEERLSQSMPDDQLVFPQAPSLEESEEVEVQKENPWAQRHKAGHMPYNHVTGVGGIQARAPPPAKGRKKAAPPPPPKSRKGLDLGLTAMQRKDSWQI